jgi:hypothetical protein
MVNPSLIPTDWVHAWAQAAEADLQALVQAPHTTLGHLEELLEALARKLMLPVLSAAAQCLASRQAFLCPICHRALLAEAKNRRRTLGTVFGSCCLQRDYGWCSHCAEYCSPADQALGLQPQAPASPRVQEIAGLLSLRDPYAQAAKDAQRLTGLSLNAASLQREAKRQGQRAMQLRQRDIELAQTPQGVAQLSARSGTSQLGPFTLIIEIDAWNIRERDDWGKTKKLRRQGKQPERWHWVFTATVFRLDQRGETQGGRRVISDRGYVVTRRPLESFTQMLYVEALLRGLLQAEQVLVIADGAIWIWNLAGDRFKDAKQRVDLFHVREHLHELARTLYGEGTAQAQQWPKPLLRFLESRKEGALDVLHELRDLRQRLQGLTRPQQKTLDQKIGYFTTHHQRMDYKQAKANGEPVGSGPVESTARQYQTRFKCTGQFWTLEGDEPLLALATLYRNERWHLLYPHAAPAPAPSTSLKAQTQALEKSRPALAARPRQR